MTGEASTASATVSAMKAQTGASDDQFEPDSLLMAAVGRSISAVELLACEARWNTHIHDVARFHAHHDLWLTPTVAAPPVTIGSMDTPWLLAQLSDVARRLGLAGVMRHTSSFKNTVLQNLGWTPYTQLANLTGRPAMSVPLYWTSQNLPLGVQFVAPLDGEGLLLRLAAGLLLALAPLMESVRSELARCRSCMVNVLPGVGARSSRTMQRGGELYGADGCTESVDAWVPRKIKHAVWIVGRSIGILVG